MSFQGFEFMDNIVKNHKHNLLLIVLIFIYHTVFLSSFVFKPDIILISIFFFCIFPRYELGMAYLILLGFLSDVLDNNMIGVSSIQYIAVSFVAIVNRKALLGQKFYIVWLMFCLVFVISIVIKAMLYSVINGINYFTLELVINIVIAFLTYPIVHIAYYKYMKMTLKDA